jgi:chemotaxis protein CheD
MNGRPDAPVGAAAPLAFFLSPGSIHCAASPTVVSTILGSCVAICLWDCAARVGGMNHFVLPRRNQHPQHPRFGDVAIDQLIDGMLRLGCSTRHLRAKVFGGAAVLPFGQTRDTVGNQNVQVALAGLRAYGIPVMAQRTGGGRGLMVRLNTETGEVLVRRLARDTALRLLPGLPEPPDAGTRTRKEYDSLGAAQNSFCWERS